MNFNEELSKSAITTVFPLAILLNQFKDGDPGFNWINMASFIVGMTDLRARSGTFTTPWEATSPYRSPLPDLSIHEPRSLEDLMDLRGQEIYQQSVKLNKKIMLMWSGGIDSTSVLISLLKNIPANEHKDRIVVCMSTDSLTENFYFYKTFISCKIPVIHRHKITFNNDLLNEYILLHGDPGDALFGPSTPKYKHLIKDGRHRLPAKDNVELLYGCVLDPALSENTGKWLVDKILENMLEVNPPNVESIADWFWWQYMNLKWEGSIWRPFHGTGVRENYSDPISKENTLQFQENTFFNTEYFQRWSHSNLQNHIPNGIESHKHDIKKYIFKFDKNESYSQFKAKTASIAINLVGGGLEVDRWAKPVYFDEHWVGHDLREPGLLDTALDCLLQYKG